MSDERYQAIKRAVGPLATGNIVFPDHPEENTFLLAIIARNSNASADEAREFLIRYFREEVIA